jgi:hypothetical protein
MPYLDSPAAAFQQATQSTETDYTLTTADAEERILSTNPIRKGHLVKNIGTSPVTLVYGFVNEDIDETTEVYRIPLSPNSVYLQDFTEVIPHTAISPVDDGLIRVIEIF